MIALLLMLSCSGTEDQPLEPEQALIPLSAPELLRRVSLDMRGVPPSLEELERVQIDPAAWRTIRDEYYADPLFQDHMVQLLAERWHTLVDIYDIEYGDYFLEPSQEYEFERSVGQEPLRLMAQVIADDLPWSEVVMANYTMANDLLIDLWPLTPAGGEGWRRAWYNDGRPGVGVLSTNGLWWRYTTNDSNMNRSRAAAITRLLLCEDFLARPVSFSLSESDDNVVTDPANAVRENPYCLACHAAIDPIAASMFGFWWVVLYSEIEDTYYHPEREHLGPAYLGLSPAWFGTPMDGLAEMGVNIANDSRFYTCAVESFSEQLWRRDTTLADFQRLEDLRVDFLNHDASPQALMSAIMETPEYQVGELAEGAGEHAQLELPSRMMSPSQLSTTLNQLTGYTWTYLGYEQLDNDTIGYRVLAGGVDGDAVTRPQSRPGLTWALVVKRVAQGAAQTVVQHDLEGDEPPRLLTKVTIQDRPDDPAFQEQLRLLHWQLYASAATPEWMDFISALWIDASAGLGPLNAWEVTLTVMFRSPEFVTY